MEQLICSAIKFRMINSEYFHIMCGKRHADIFETMFHLGIKYDKITHIQGFMTDNNRFIDRYEAYEIAKANGQLICEGDSRILYSEDVWPE